MTRLPTGFCVVIFAMMAQNPSYFTEDRKTLRSFVHKNSPTQHKYLLETMGGGIAVFDYNNDGLLDVFLVNGGRTTTGKDFGRKDPQYWNRLFRQNKDGSFADVTVGSGLETGSNGYGMGVAAGDIDNDGWVDLYVTNYGPNILYRNTGKGTFEDVTTADAAAGGWSASAGFFDYDNDGKLDLFVTRYLDWYMDRNILCGTPFNAYCRPDRFGPVANVLLHNEGGGRFKDASRASGIATVPGKALGVGFHDFDGDGFADIFVANDGMEQYLFHNRQNGTFEEVALERGVAFADDGKPFAGMGVAFDDFDNDGKPDIAVTDLALEKYALFRNEVGGNFRYASATTGLAALSARSSGWGVKFADFDNDGWKDLFVAQSHVLDNVERIHSGLRYLEPAALYRGHAGMVVERIDLGTPIAGRGAAFGDLNNDGAMDVVMTALGTSPVIWKGVPKNNHWLIVKLIGSRSNRQGLGAHVRVNGITYGYASTAGSYLSASDSRVHLGLGSKEEVDLEIEWPGGSRKQTIRKVRTNQVLEVREP
jgi:hypothetical protein